MNKPGNKWILLLVVVICVVSCDTSLNVDPIYKNYYIKYFGDDGDSEAIDMVINSDNTFMLLGNSISPSGKRRIYVIKADSKGNVLWQRKFGDGFEHAQDIEPTGSGFVILSNVDVGNGQVRFKLIRIDTDGSKIDSLVYDVLTDQFARSVTPLSDGGFYVVGSTSDTDINENTTLPIPDFKDLLFVRFDNTFSKANSFIDRVGKSSEGSAIRVFENPNGTFTYAGYSDELVDNSVDAQYESNFIFRSFTFDPKNVSSTFIGDDVKNEVMNQSFRAQDGSFYAIGTAMPASGNNTVFVCKTRNSTAAPTKIFANDLGGGKREGVSIHANIASCLILGNQISEADGTRDIWLSKINSITGEQEPQWLDGLTFGTPANDDTGSVVLEAANGDILILGTFNLTNQRKMAVIRLRSNGKFE